MKLSMVTRSLGRPYPLHPVSIEKMEMHKGLLKAQDLQILEVRREINTMKANEIRFCETTFRKEKKRLKDKIAFLKTKFNPIIKEKRARPRKGNKTAKNKKSRERYKARKIKGKIKRYNENITNGQRTVINLSSHDMSMAEIFALQLGYGFVPTPNHQQKEEETLILEGMRFIDRIGKLDVKLREEEQRNERTDEPNRNGENRIPNNNSGNNNNSNGNPSPDSNLTQTDQVPTIFKRSKDVPYQLQFSNPKEEQLQNRHTKLLKKEFDEFNTNLINTFDRKKKRHNLPKKVRDALSNIHKLVKRKEIDVRKVDKGQVILVVDYTERIKVEASSINEIAEEVPDQRPNWKENREFVETMMKRLFAANFIDGKELTSVTGLLAGGVSGDLLNPDGSLKFTRIKENNELFAKQSTPYVYPLFKLHKMPIERVLQLRPDEVADSIPSRLVVGMSNCQLSRVQCWLETFLTPLAKLYGDFEYIKDSTDMLQHIETTKKNLQEAGDNNWDDKILFTIDVRALYPSVKFPYLFDSIKDCFKRCTKWSNHQIALLLELIFYTLRNQQIQWEEKIYTFKQGLLTGGKHSVPLANIFLTYIMKELLRTNTDFKRVFNEIIVLWKRFIDDCAGISKGNIYDYLRWFKILQEHFQKFNLELTTDTDSFTIDGDIITEKETKVATVLDMDIFIEDNTIHTKEHRKETSASTYLHYTSAHPRYTFKGIMKSQILRIRRLCSRDEV